MTFKTDFSFTDFSLAEAEVGFRVRSSDGDDDDGDDCGTSNSLMLISPVDPIDVSEASFDIFAAIS